MTFWADHLPFCLFDHEAARRKHQVQCLQKTYSHGPIPELWITSPSPSETRCRPHSAPQMWNGCHRSRGQKERNFECNICLDQLWIPNVDMEEEEEVYTNYQNKQKGKWSAQKVISGHPVCQGTLRGCQQGDEKASPKRQLLAIGRLVAYFSLLISVRGRCLNFRHQNSHKVNFFVGCDIRTLKYLHNHPDETLP